MQSELDAGNITDSWKGGLDVVKVAWILKIQTDYWKGELGVCKVNWMLKI